MNINLHIEQLVLDGIAVEPYHQADLKAAVVSELSRLLVSNGINSAVQSSNRVRATQDGLIAFGMHPEAFVLGQQIAQSVYGGITHE